MSMPQDITYEAAIYGTTFTLDLYVLKYVSPWLLHWIHMCVCVCVRLE